MLLVATGRGLPRVGTVKPRPNIADDARQPLEWGKKQLRYAIFCPTRRDVYSLGQWHHVQWFASLAEPAPFSDMTIELEPGGYTVSRTRMNVFTYKYCRSFPL